MYSLAYVGFIFPLLAVALLVGFIFLLVFLMKNAKQPRRILKLVYLYILSFVGIVITVVSAIGMIDLVLKQYVFQVDNYGYYYAPDTCRSKLAPVAPTENVNAPAEPSAMEIEKCEQEEKDRSQRENLNQVKRDLSSQTAGLLIGLPLWLYHWGMIRKEKEEEE